MIEPTIEQEGVTFPCQYVPKLEGEYIINVLYKNRPAQDNPFQVVVGPASSSPVVAFGPGLIEYLAGFAGNACHFTVEMNSAVGTSLHVVFEGPSQCISQRFRNPDKSHDVIYIPQCSGNNGQRINIMIIFTYSQTLNLK